MYKKPLTILVIFLMFFSAVYYITQTDLITEELLPRETEGMAKEEIEIPAYPESLMADIPLVYKEDVRSVLSPNTDVFVYVSEENSGNIESWYEAELRKSALQKIDTADGRGNVWGCAESNIGLDIHINEIGEKHLEVMIKGFKMEEEIARRKKNIIFIGKDDLGVWDEYYNGLSFN